MASAPRINKDEGSPMQPTEIDITKTPEFQSALNDAVNRALGEALGPLKDQIAAARPGDVVSAGATEIGGAENLLQRLAHLIASVNDQGSGRPERLPPDVLARREGARVRMFDAIQAMRERVKSLTDDGRRGAARAATPRYRAMTKMHLNEHFIEPFKMDPGTRQPVPVEFLWTGPPNQAMLPVNEPALEIFNHYRDWIGGISAAAAKPGFISPSGIVILVGDKYSPPATAMQRNGFTPDYGDVDLNPSTEFSTGPFSDELSMASEYGAHGSHDPRARKIHVLGTIAPAIEQAQPNDVVRRSV